MSFFFHALGVELEVMFDGIHAVLCLKCLQSDFQLRRVQRDSCQ